MVFVSSLLSFLALLCVSQGQLAPEPTLACPAGCPAGQSCQLRQVGCPTGTQGTGAQGTGAQGTGASCVPVVVPTCLPPIPPIDQCGGCPQGKVCQPSGLSCLRKPCPVSKCVNAEPQLGSCPTVTRFLPRLNFACLGERFRVRFCASDENCRKDLSQRCCVSQCNRRVCTADPVAQ